MRGVRGAAFEKSMVLKEFLAIDEFQPQRLIARSDKASLAADSGK